MSPRINSEIPTKRAYEFNNGYLNRDSVEPLITGTLHGGLGGGQVGSFQREAFLPQKIASRAAGFKTALPRLGGALVTISAAGYDLTRAFRTDRDHNDTTYLQTRRQVVTTALSASAGFAVGSLAGAATAGAVVVGAPAVIGAGIAGIGIVGAGLAASYVYNWAAERVTDWVR